MPTNCGMFDHVLVDGCLVTNPDHINFIKKSVKDFWSRSEVCRVCKISMEYVYERKMYRAKRKKQLENKTKSRSQSGFESVSSNSIPSIGCEQDTIDQIVQQTPKHRSIQRNESSRDSRERSRGVSLIVPQRPNVKTQDTIDQIVQQTPKHRSLRRNESSRDSRERSRGVSSTPLIVPQRPNVKTPGGGSASNKSVTFQPILAAPLQAETSNPEVISPTIYSDENQSQNGQEDIDKRGNDAQKQAEQIKSPVVIARAIVSTHQDVEVMNGSEKDVSVQSKQNGDVDKRTHSVQIHREGINTPAVAATSSSTSNVRLSPEHSTSPAAISSANVRLSQEPSTSKAAGSKSTTKQSEAQKAAESRKRSFSQHSVGEDADDDDEPLYSLNAFNGTRLPNVQPIIKRSRNEFHHPNPDVMKIYAQGLIGG